MADTKLSALTSAANLTNVTLYGEQSGASRKVPATLIEPAGTASTALAAHVAAGDPHAQYALESALGDAASKNVGTSAGTVAAGDHAHSAADITSGTLAVARGGTGTSSPSLVAGSNVTITGTWPNQTIAASASGTGDVLSSAPVLAGSVVTTAAAMAALEIDWTKSLNTKSVNADTTFTLSTTPATANTRTNFRLTNSGATARTITIPSCWSIVRGQAITSFTLEANAVLEMQFVWTGAEVLLFGDPMTAAQVKSALAITGSDVSGVTFTAGSNITLGGSWPSLTINSTASGSGDVVGPASATDDGLAVFDGTTGKLIQVATGWSVVNGELVVSADSNPGYLIFKDADATDPEQVVLTAPTDITTSYTLVWPAAVGSKDQALVISSLTGTVAQLGFASSAGSGTVTKVSVTTANGVSGSVANDTTTPEITISLGAITPTSVNGVTISGSSTPTLAVTGTSAISGSNTGDQTTITGNAGTATKLETARTINGVSFDGTANITVTAAGSTLSNTVPVGKGGTGLTSGTSGGIPFFSSTSAITSSAALADNGVVIGGGAGATPETVAGITTNGTSQLQLGVAGTSVGSVQLRNATSGSITIQPATGALGTITVTVPATTGTVYVSSGSDVSVADGGTGRSTSTTAYGLIAAGTTATGALQTLATGATTDILVSGGSSALPVWTTATGSGAPVRATSPTLVTPILGTPTSGTLTNCTGLPVATGISGLGTGVATALAVNTGSAGAVVVNGGALGTPSSGTLTSCTMKDQLGIACSDETTALTTGTAKVTFRMPYAMTLTAVRATVTTAPTGSTLVVDINEGGTSILGTKLSIDASEKTSTTAASAATITDSALADDAEITVDIDQVGSTVAGAGLKVWLIGTRS